MKHWTRVIIITLLSFLQRGFADEFQSFKPTEKFNQLFLASEKSHHFASTDNNQLIDVLTPEDLKANPQTQLTNGLDFSSFPWDRIFKILAPYLMSYGTTRTADPLNELLHWEKKFGGRIKNFGTIEWHEPLGYISVHNRREIDASTSSRVEVNDVLELVIHADSFLQHLANHKLIEISHDQLSAFANIKYHKIFRYKHFKSALEEARKADLTTLLFPFKFFHFPDLLQLKKEDEISHSDYLSFNLKGSASANFWTFIKAGVSVAATLEHNQSSVIKITKDSQMQDIYQLKKTTGTTTQLAVDTSVAIDLFKIIDLTLIKLNYEYLYQKSKTSFYQAPLTSHLWNWTGEELMTAKSVHVNSGFLLWGKSKSKEEYRTSIRTESKKIQINQRSWSNETHVHSFVGGILSNLLGDLLSSFLGFSKKFSSHQDYTYAETSDDDNFQLDFSRALYLDNRSSLWSLSKVHLMTDYILKHNLLPENVKNLWRQKYFQKNIYAFDQYSFSSKLFSHLQWLSPHHFQVSAVYLCGLSHHPGVDLESIEQPIQFNQLNWKEKNCVKRSYDKLMLVMSTHNLQEKTKRFLNYLTFFLKHSPDSSALYYLFPANLMTHHHTFLAKSKKGEKFKGSYSRGDRQYPTLSNYFLQRFSIWRE